jgi:hypothetical protein
MCSTFNARALNAACARFVSWCGENATACQARMVFFLSRMTCMYDMLYGIVLTAYLLLWIIEEHQGYVMATMRFIRIETTKEHHRNHI